MTFLFGCFYSKSVVLTQLQFSFSRSLKLVAIFFFCTNKATGSIRGTCSKLGMKLLVCTHMAQRLFFLLSRIRSQPFYIGQFKWWCQFRRKCSVLSSHCSPYQEFLLKQEGHLKTRGGARKTISKQHSEEFSSLCWQRLRAISPCHFHLRKWEQKTKRVPRTLLRCKIPSQ